MRACVAILAALALAGCGGGARKAVATVPVPLHGKPLKGRTGLRLLVSGAPPYVLDVDSGKVSRVTGLRFGRPAVDTVQGVGRDAAIWVDPQRVYALRHGSLRARRIARGRELAPGDGGRAVWTIAQRGKRCSLAEISLAGRHLRAPRHVPCSAHLLAIGATAAALVHGNSVTRLSGARDAGHVVHPWAVAGQEALGWGRPLTLVDLATGKERALGRPSALRWQDQAATAPDGRRIALDFADPAYHGTGTQVMDVWLLDTGTGRLTQLPSMPAKLHLKATSFAWAPDGRLVLLSQDYGIVAVWRPGETQLALRHVNLPRPSGGSDAFTVW